MLNGKKMESWSWRDLVRILIIYNRMLNDFQRIKNKCILLNLSIGEFEIAHGRYINRIGVQIDIVNAEIERRNNLVGVM